MEMVSITGYDLYNAFLSGFSEVSKQRSFLNRINVFPVPDGDTGSNLVSTLAAIINETKASDCFKATMNLMADAALNGARGNSGIILAQFINGINYEIKKAETITLGSLVDSIRQAVPYAYTAIMEPIEGTMITVIREWSEAMGELKNTAISVEDFVLRSLDAARQSLANTPNLLEVLKKSSVVDSGAYGFVAFLEGVARFIRNRIINSTTDTVEKVDLEIEDEHLDFTEEINFRYCTEALISNLEADIGILKQRLTPLGDSLIIAGTNEKARIHIHTNEPTELFNILRDGGNVLQQKVDDMKQQYLVANERRHSIAIMTDSIADLPKELVEEHQIHVLPLNLIIGGSPYLDKLTIAPNDFYALMDKLKEYPTSSLPSQKSVEDIFSLLTDHYEAVIVITVSKEMSGTYHIMEKAARKFLDQGKQIKVIDSKLNSGAQGLLVLDAARQLDDGRNLEQVIEHIESQIQKTKIYVSVRTLKYMVRGGRISPLTGFVGQLFNVKPIVSIDENGRGIAFGNAFTMRANIDKIVELVKKSHSDKPIRSYSIVHAHSESHAQGLALRIPQELGLAPEYISEISTIVGLNAGVGSVAVSFMQK